MSVLDYDYVVYLHASSQCPHKALSIVRWMPELDGRPSPPVDLSVGLLFFKAVLGLLPSYGFTSYKKVQDIIVYCPWSPYWEKNV